MMTTFETPNHIRHNGDKSGSWVRFGVIHSITPINLPGEGHSPRVSIRFRGGVTVDLDPATATELARRLPALLAFMPVIPDVSGAVADLEEVL